MNTLDIYSLSKKNNKGHKRSSLRTMFLGAFLMLAGTQSSFAIGTPPTFVNGNPQSISACQNSAPTAINNLLTVTDPNTGETETWSIFAQPAHGTVTTGSTTTAVIAGPGIPVTPSGFTYQPTPGFSGTDAFQMQVSDGSNTVTLTVNVTVNALPAIETFTGGGGYCSGGAGTPVGLTISEAGVSYQLYDGTGAIGAPVTGTGFPVGFGTYANPDYYYAIATGPGSCTSTLPGVTIHVDPLPGVFGMTGGGDYCSDGTGVAVGLDGSEVGVDYQLYEGVNPIGSPVAGTGSALDFGVQPAGDYSVIATNGTTTCVNNMTGVAHVGLFPSPTVYNVIGGGYYCLGASGAPIMLDGSQSNVSYQLIYLGFVPLNSPVLGVDDTLDLGTEMLPGDYTVVATDTLNGCVSNMAGSVNVNFALPPAAYSVTQTRGGNYCIGDSGIHVGLSNSAVDVEYQLYRNDTAVGAPLAGTGSPLDYGLFTIEGTYTVKAVNTVTGCTRNMNGNSIVKVNPNVVPTVSITSGIGTGNEVCNGALATFTAQTHHGGDAPFYEWMINNISVPGSDSTYSYVPVNGEVISVIVHSNENCANPLTATNTLTVNVDTLIAPSVFLDVTPHTSVLPNTPVTITAMPTHGGPTPAYQWFKNGTVVNNNTNTYTSTFNDHDSVSVRMTSSGGCGGVVAVNSVIITIFGLSVPNVSAITDVKLVPNPNTGAFSVKGTLATTNDAEVSLEVTNILGQVVYTGKTTAKAGIVNEQIQLNNAANGMYILNIRTANEQSVIRFVIEK